jgi:acyl-CoA reductase-like NAD-dependent aldehyde dehydrogenase
VQPSPAPYGLVASVFTRDTSKAMRAEEAEGVVFVGCAPTLPQEFLAEFAEIHGGEPGASAFEAQPPFGGTRGTGNDHREAGQAPLDSYSEWKSVYID